MLAKKIFLGVGQLKSKLSLIYAATMINYKKHRINQGLLRI